MSHASNGEMIPHERRVRGLIVVAW